MDGLFRKLASVAVGVATVIGLVVFVFPSACAAVEGVPSWERCSTAIGTPAFSFTDWGLGHTVDVLVPLVVGVLAGGVTWWLLGLGKSGR